MTIHRGPSRAALAGALAVSALALAAPPSLARDVHVSGHAKITIKGHGFGHGRGLSQYGARGAAEQGLSAKQILHFYYPHTTFAHKITDIAVLITEDTDERTVVLNRAGLRVRQIHGNEKFKLPTAGKIGKATQWRLSGGAGRSVHISYRKGSWHRWRTMPSDAEFVAKKPITLVLPAGDVTYRGAIQSRIPPPGTSTLGRVTINKLHLEEYIQGVVPREMPALWPAAALQAQAVAARTYAAFEARHSPNKMWGVCDTSSCQVYGGKSSETKMSNAAVAKTKGKILLYHGAPAFTQFGSSDGGWTAKLAGDPFLPAKKDPYEKHSGNPYQSWTVHVKVKKIEKAWPTLGTLQSISSDQRDGNGQWGGRVLELTLHGSAGDVRFGYPDDLTRTVGIFTSTLGLRSAWFRFSVA
jgi:stage II sporulation protein D